MLPLRTDPDATSPLVGLMVASFLFTATFAFVVAQGIDDGSNASDAGHTARLATTAASLSALIVDNPGELWYPMGSPCPQPLSPLPQPQPDADRVAVGRFGLAVEDCADGDNPGRQGNLLDFEKILSLEGWGMEADGTNGSVDYPEARTGLGMNLADPHFNIRGTPAVPESVLEALNGERNKLVKPLYIGEYDATGQANGAGDIQGTCKQGAAVDLEVAMIAALVDPTKFDPFSRVPKCSVAGAPGAPPATLAHDPGGDVIPAYKPWLTANLQTTLDDERPTVIIVGSNAGHSELTAQVKTTIDDWVLDGGYLVVFGHEQVATWMRSILKVASSNSPSANGATVGYRHAVLTTPNRLDYPAYDTTGHTWKPTSSGINNFREVLVEDAGNSPDGFLSLAPYGNIGRGQVLVTSYRPFALTGDEATLCDHAGPGGFSSDCAGLQLVQNFITVGYHGLYIDFGPAIPTDRESRSVTRLTAVDHPDLKLRIPVLLTVTVFE